MKKLLVFVCLMILFCFALGAQMKMEPGACEKKAQVLVEENPGRVLQGQPLQSLEDYQ